MGRQATGSVRQKRPGVWEVRIPIAPDPTTRKRRQHSQLVYGDERAALNVRDALLVEHGGRDLQPASRTVTQLFEAWITSPGAKTGKPRSASSVYQERRRYLRHIEPAFGRIDPKRIRTVDVNRLYDALLRQGLSSTSVRRVHQLLSAMFSWGSSLGYATANPATGALVPSSSTPLPAAPTTDVVETLLDAAEKIDPELLLVLRLAAVTAARRSELAGLRWSHVDLGKKTVTIEVGEIHVPKQGRVETDTKTGFGAVLSLDDDTVELLKDHLGRQQTAMSDIGCEFRPEAYVFSADPCGSQAWHPDTLSSRVRRLTTRVPGAEGVTLKSLRAYVASELAGDGVDPTTAQAVLRHRSAATTARHYQAARETRVRSATRGLGERLKPRST